MGLFSNPPSSQQKSPRESVQKKKNRKNRGASRTTSAETPKPLPVIFAIEDVVAHICQFLYSHNVESLALCSRKMRDSVRADSTWELLFFRDATVPTQHAILTLLSQEDRDRYSKNGVRQSVRDYQWELLKPPKKNKAKAKRVGIPPLPTTHLGDHIHHLRKTLSLDDIPGANHREPSASGESKNVACQNGGWCSSWHAVYRSVLSADPQYLKRFKEFLVSPRGALGDRLNLVAFLSGKGSSLPLKEERAECLEIYEKLLPVLHVSSISFGDLCKLKTIKYTIPCALAGFVLHAIGGPPQAQHVNAGFVFGAHKVTWTVSVVLAVTGIISGLWSARSHTVSIRHLPKVKYLVKFCALNAWSHTAASFLSSGLYLALEQAASPSPFLPAWVRPTIVPLVLAALWATVWQPKVFRRVPTELFTRSGIPLLTKQDAATFMSDRFSLDSEVTPNGVKRKGPPIARIQQVVNERFEFLKQRGVAFDRKRRRIEKRLSVLSAVSAGLLCLSNVAIFLREVDSAGRPLTLLQNAVAVFALNYAIAALPIGVSMLSHRKPSPSTVL